MSNWRGPLEENAEVEAAVDWFASWYHVLAGGALLVFMLWNRVKSWQNFVVDGQVLFSGNDAWYHYRTVTYTVRHWPETMPFDPWTHFPIGTSSGQFGTFFDQIIATGALIVGLGSPDQGTIAMTHLFAPAIFGVAAGIPAYFIGRRLGGRVGGLTALAVLAFSSGGFLARSTVGFSDHQVAEALFQTLGVLGIMVAVGVAERDRPIYEQFLDRDIEALRATVGWSVLGGFAVALYLWVWPPGVLLLGILGVYFLVRLSIEHLRDGTPEHTAIAGTISMTATGIFALASIHSFRITATDPSLLQPLLAFGVAAGCVFMAWLSRYWEQESLDARYYPAAVGGIIVVGTGLVAVLLPDLYGFFVNNVTRVIGLTTSPTAGTVGEAQPLRRPARLFRTNGLAVFLAAIGAVAILVEQWLSDDPSAEQLLVVVWAVFLTLATFTQARFAYYLVFPIAVLSGLVVGRVFSWADISFRTDDIAAYQVLTFVAVLFAVVAPMFLVAPSPVAAGNSGPGQGVQGWNGALDWMEENTPEEGEFGGASNQLEYYGTYQTTDDYDYQEGQYGVMSWWDYGHWITVNGERIPNANPFQQGSGVAANFLLAPNETQANNVLDETDEDDAKTRYVAVDWKMVNVYGQYGGKFFAPPEFYDVSNVTQSDYYRGVTYQTQRGNLRFYSQEQAYYNTTVVRLYRYHGSAVEPQPVVFDWSYAQTRGGGQARVVPPQEPNSTTLRQFNSMEAARQYANEDGSAQVGGVGALPSKRVPAMEHYRLVGTSDRTAYSSASHNAAVLSTAQGLGIRIQRPRPDGTCRQGTQPISAGTGTFCLPNIAKETIEPQTPYWTKVFERVPGATIRGSGPENVTVRASVQMRNPAQNTTFTYEQQVQTGPDGNFTMTVPYSTTGYDEWGPENG
ncbi:MAG: oligosaccharyl transferase, archaeosortase A system-associated, partial [Haloarculaceae archaeon]